MRRSHCLLADGQREGREAGAIQQAGQRGGVETWFRHAAGSHEIGASSGQRGLRGPRQWPKRSRRWRRASKHHWSSDDCRTARAPRRAVGVDPYCTPGKTCGRRAARSRLAASLKPRFCRSRRQASPRDRAERLPRRSRISPVPDWRCAHPTPRRGAIWPNAAPSIGPR